MHLRDIIDKYYEKSLESNHRIHRGICNRVMKQYPDLIDLIEETALEVVNNSEDELLDIIHNCEDPYELEKELSDYLITEIVASYFTGFIWHYVVKNHKKIEKMIENGEFDKEKILTEDDFAKYNIEIEKILFEEHIDCGEKIKKISEFYGIDFDGEIESDGERLIRNEIILSYAVAGEDFPDYIQNFFKRKKLDDIPKHKIITMARMNLIP